MSRGNEFSDDEIERVTAVAAAAYAIHSIQNSEIARRKKNADYPETSSFPKFTHLKEDNRPPTPRPAPEPAKLSRRLIGNKFFYLQTLIGYFFFTFLQIIHPPKIS